MNRDIQFSIPDVLVSRAARDDTGTERDFLREVRNQCDTVKLFVTPPPHGQPDPLGFLNTDYQLESQIQWLQEYGLDVPSVHGTPYTRWVLEEAGNDVYHR